MMSQLGKLIIGFLFSDVKILQDVLDILQNQKHLRIQHQSALFDFVQTHYYEPEMGPHLKRQFISFQGVFPKDQITEWKHKTTLLEEQWSIQHKRQINLDPGYLDLHQVVLLSHKPGPQKIFLQPAIWADLVLLKNKGGYEHFPWTFPDLRTHQYDPFFLQARNDYKQECREWKSETLNK